MCRYIGQTQQFRNVTATPAKFVTRTRKSEYRLSTLSFILYANTKEEEKEKKRECRHLYGKEIRLTSSLHFADYADQGWNNQSWVYIEHADSS